MMMDLYGMNNKTDSIKRQTISIFIYVDPRFVAIEIVVDREIKNASQNN
jgi:hypothetical protein